MPALFFPNLDALRLAIASGLVPPAISQAPARAASDTSGHVWLEIDELPSRESLAALGRFGVRAHGSLTGTTQPIRCWAEVLPLRRIESRPTALTLFEVPDRKLAAFVGRLQRLQKPPFGIRLLPEPHAGRAWVTAVAPATSLLLDDPNADVRAYWEQCTNVWVMRGWEHPLAGQLAIPANSVLLCDPERGVVSMAGSAPAPLHEEFPLLPRTVVSSSAARLPKIDIRFRLKRRNDTREETLWVLAPAELDSFREFCHSADERLLRQFELASVSNGEDLRYLVRRTKEDRTSPLPMLAGSFQPDSRLPWLFVPSGFTLRPLIRVRELARELARAADHLVWVESADSGVAIHSVPESAFRPLWEQVEYAAPHGVALSPELRADETFAFDRFSLQLETTIDLESPEEASEPREEEPAGRVEAEPGWVTKSLSRMLRWARRHRPHADAAVDAEEEIEITPSRRPPRPAEAQAGRVERNLSSPDALLHGHDWAARRHELETRLLADFSRLSPDSRAKRWAELASVYAATGQSQDAAVCWTNALWDCGTPQESWLEQWAIAECRAAKRSARVGDLERWLGEPGRSGTGRVVASLAALHGFRANPLPEFVAALPRVLAILEQQFDDIPVRGAWLARLAVARSCDGDALGVARWRDRLIRRLHERGPGLDLDEPSFLRFRGRATAERFKVARDWLIRLQMPVREWAGKHAGISGLQAFGLAAETKATPLYAQMMIAWGLGVLGERATSRDWSARARKELSRASGPRADPAGHALLGDLFLHRIKEAHEGHVPKPGLPTEFQQRLDKLPEFARHSADHLREHSRILQPVGAVSAYRSRNLKPFWGNDRLGERLALLALRTDPTQLNEEARALLAIASETPATTTIPRIVFSLLPIAPYLDSAQLDSLLELVPTALDWIEVWVQAGGWTDAERSKCVLRFRTQILESAFAIAPPATVEHLMRFLIRNASSGSMTDAILAVGASIFRAARRCELSATADALIQILDPARAEWVEPLTPERVGLAVGWLVAGDDDVGNRILNAARDSLFIAPNNKLRHQPALALAYAEALGFAPASIALGRLEEIFQRLDPDTHRSSNCYFTLQRLRLIDTVVRSVVTDDFTLGPKVRAWLDEDEFLIRRRIHRDMATLLRGSESS
jgi:hypothetical protein